MLLFVCHTVLVRLAWFTPWPPQRSGVAGRSAELVPLLAQRGHGIDIFVDEQAVAVTRASDDEVTAGEVRLQSAHDFVWRAHRQQFDLVVYQVGNSRLHDFIWPYLLRWPGLAVLHDARLHHARGHARLSRHMVGRYRDEFARNHPDACSDAAELAVRGFEGAYYYQWPMVADLIDASKMVATHSRGTTADLAAAWPDRPIVYVPLGEGRIRPVSPAEREAVRRLLKLPSGAVLFGVFGALTAEKRVPQVLRAFATTVAHSQHARLLLCGTADPHLNITAKIEALGIGDHVIQVDTPHDDEFDRLVAAVDVGVHLRWPTALETSGPWLRALAAGHATVTTDLVHMADVPSIDPRDWREPPGTSGAVTIAVDVVDEDHSLRLAMQRLATDAGLRDRLGLAARRYWEAGHTVERMVDAYDQLLPRARDRPALVGETAAHQRLEARMPVAALLHDFREGTCTFD
jgi:glycosyltransferase involved in cell wall biosynthesis